MNTSMMNQYKYLAKQGDGALAFNGSVPCYLPNKANGCYESENGSLMFYGKCVQNGTPSPSSPVAVEYVDGDGAVFKPTHNLPSGYTEVEYLESHGTEYIYTGFSTNAENFKIITSVILMQFGTERGFVGSSSNGRIELYTEYNGNLRFWNPRWMTGGINASLNTRYNISAEATPNSGVLTIDDTSYTAYGVRELGIYNVTLFAHGDTRAICKMFFCKLYDNDVLVRNFIPCFRNSDNESGMYDTVNGVFYTNQGTGRFSVGGTQTLTMPDLYGIGDIRDTYEPCVWVNGALRSRLTRRIGVVDLGTLGWIISTRYNRWYSYGLSGIAKGSVYTVAANALCQNFPIQSQEASVSDLSSTGISIEGNGNQTNVRSTSTIPTTMSPAEVKAAMSGVLLYYELANPVITLGDPQPVQSYGGATNIFHTSVVKPKITATVVTHS